MERLKPLDEVAYVRFASVYRQFKDIDSFMRELNKILEERWTPPPACPARGVVFCALKGSPFRGRIPLSGGNVPKGQKG